MPAAVSGGERETGPARFLHRAAGCKGNPALLLMRGQVFCIHSIPFFKHLGFVVCFFKATVTLAQGRTNINCQKTACSEKLHRAKPQPHHSLQARSPSGEGRKAAFGVLRESAAEKLQVQSAAAPRSAQGTTFPRAPPALTWLFPRRR